MNAQAVAMGAITQIRALGGVIGLAIVTNVLNSYIKSQLSISLSKEQMALLLQSTAYIPTFPPELQALLGDDLPTALRFASAAGALCTTAAGAVPSIPRRAAVEALLSAG